MGELDVFISYRRADTQHLAGRLGDRISQRFSLFMDIDNIPLGVDFSTALTEAISASDVLLVLIGPRFLPAGPIHQTKWSDDWVLAEVGAALANNLVVIPILVDDARMPDQEQLPKELWPLCRRQAMRLSHASFNGDVDKLLVALGKIAEARRNPSPPEAEPVPDRRIAAATVPDPVAASSGPTSRTPAPSTIADSRRIWFVGGGTVAVLGLIQLTAQASLYYRHGGFGTLLPILLIGLCLFLWVLTVGDARHLDAVLRLHLLRWSAIASASGVIAVGLSYATVRDPIFKGAHYYVVSGDHSASLPVYLPVILAAHLVGTVVWYVALRRGLGRLAAWPCLLYLACALAVSMILIFAVVPT